MRSLIYFLLDPITIGIILVLTAYGMSIWKPKLGRIGWWVTALYGTFLLLTPIPKLLVVELESRYTPIIEARCAADLHIVVLASGFTADEQLPPSTQLDRSSLGRLIEGLRLANTCPAATLIVSGPDNDEGISQAAVTRKAAASLGIAGHRMLVLDNPINTAAEAAAVNARVGDNTPIILVTSAIHMHRSVYWFESEGLTVQPSPTDYLIKKDSDYRWYTWSPVQNISLFDAWIHETIGLCWAKWIT